MVEPRVGENFDRYLVEERLGAGGMGEVFRAQDTKLRRQVALKVVRTDPGTGSGSNSDGAVRLLREARAAAALDHPNAVAIFDVGELDGCAYIAMELVDGRNMRAYVGDVETPVADKVRWLVDAARALSAAHKRGLVHRDVKPENVMIRSDGAVKVLDFGIARRVQSGTSSGAPTVDADTITREGVVIGTPVYMAPEQLRGEAIDGRADQFAWGVLAFELLTGALPWPSQAGAVHVVAAILSQPVEPLASLVPDIAPEVSEAVARALSKNKAERFADMDDLIRALGGKIVSLTPSAPRAKSSSPLARTPDALAATRPSGDPATAPRAPASRSRTTIVALAGAAAIATFALAVGKRSPSPSPTSPSASTSANASASASTHATAPLPTGDWSQRRLTAFAAENRVRALAVSADATTFAYADEEGVWIAPVGGSGARRAVPMPKEIADERPEQIEFFPDGARILVGGWKRDESPTWIVPIDGSAPTRARVARGFALSPDGTRLAHARDNAVVVGPVIDGPTSRVASIARDETVLLAWSPSGTALAMLRMDTNGFSQGIEVVAADGSWMKTALTGTNLVHTGAMRPVWTAPDRIAFAETLNDEETGISELALDATRAAMGVPRRIWKGPLSTLEELTYRAGRFFYIRGDSQRDVYVGRMSADGMRLESPLARFTTSDANDSLAGWLPDGRVLFTSLRDGKARVYAQALGARAPEVIGGDAEMSAAGALPNGDVVAVRHDAADSKFVVFKPGGAVRELFSLGAITFRFGRAELCARCSTAAPSRCIFSQEIDDAIAFTSFDPATGVKSTPFYRADRGAGLMYCSVSSDGSTLFLPHKDAVKIVTIASGATRDVKGPASSYLQYYAPLPGGRRSLMTGMFLFGKQYALARVDSDAHFEPLWISDTLWIWSPMLAPNGRDLAAIVRLFDTDVFTLVPPGTP